MRTLPRLFLSHAHKSRRPRTKRGTGKQLVLTAFDRYHENRRRLDGMVAASGGGGSDSQHNKACTGNTLPI